MEKFLSLITVNDLQSVLTSSFDVSVVPPARHKDIFLVASHCCLNGPVGTNKQTTFPVVGGPVSICDLAGIKVSNNSWKGFCKEVAVLIKKHFPEASVGCQQLVVAGDLWPIAPSIFEFRNNSSN